MDTPEPHDPNAAPTLGAEIEAPSPPPAPPSSIPPPPLPVSPSPPPSTMTYPPTSPSSPSRTLRPEQQTDVQLDSEEEQPPEGGAQSRPRLDDAFANAQGREGRGSFMVEDPASPQGDHVSLPSLTRTLSQEDVRHKPRPGIQPYGSMRAGTQTLIQALSAVPWTADASDDEGGGDLSRASTKSFKGKGKESPLGQGADVPTQPPPAPRRLASSLHTVYRPVALSQARSPSQSTIVQPPPPPPHHHHHHRSHRSPETPSSPEISSVPMPPTSLPSPLPASPPTRHRAPSSAASTHSHSSELHFPFKENTVARHAKPISSTETDYQLSALGRQEDASVTEDAVVRGEAGMGGSSSPSLEVREAGAGALRREKDRKASTETDAGLKRRKELAEMLREVFKLEEVEEVVGELACWLLRSVLLQGYMYLTTGHVCFYAHMPAKSENKVIKSGPLSKKSNRKIGSSTKYWFILKNAVLSWYVSSADPYFPHGNVDLQYAIDCEAVDEKTIKLTTNRRSYTFTSDTAASREEWVKAIRKVMFRTQHEGENVKIAIPLEAILDVETTSSLDFAETIEIKVVEGDETTLAFDSYFFAYFTNIDAAVVQIREVITTYRPQEQGSAPGWEKEQVYDTTMINRLGGRRGSSPSEGAIKPQMGAGSGISRIGSLLHPFSTGSSSTKSSPAESPRRSGEFASGSGSAPIPISSRRSKDVERDSSSSTTAAPPRLSTTPDSIRTVTPPPTSSSHTSYPPRSTSGPPPPGLELVHTSSTSSWAPSNFIRRPSMKIFASGASGAASSLLSSVRPASLIGKRRKNTPSSRKPVVEKVERAMSTTDGLSDSTTDGWEGEGNGNGRASGSGGFSMMEKSETVDREEVEADREFHEWFAMGKKEVLLEHFAGFLFRVVPVSGKVFISTNHFCFKATALLYKTTMVIPIKDIIALQPQKAFRFGHHGLAVVIKGHEELFLEFSSSERRDACKSLLEQQMDQLRFKALHGPQPVSDQQQEALILQDLDTMGFSSPQRRKSTTNKHRHSRELSSTSGTGTDATGRSHSSPGSGYGSDHLPPVMFTSTESTFLDFKPKEPMHITCLTIGSRGDVQPYIALCKGLKAEGHSVRIASHGEYKDWIEGHGIEFGYVGGDPAELMRICIENGMFTVSFIKEGLNKFREWIDDLLVTSWDACQGTDLLIESPSAMGGIHIAEGLGIPYYRAFTMPWSRTRAYPHAFAVPDHHRGGSYNYMTYTMFDQVFWRAISGQINRWRKKVIGISSTNLDKLEPHKVPFLYNFSPTVVPPPLDWYEWIRITGYWFLDDPDDSANKKWSPPDGLLEFMAKAREDGKKIVYIGFGSIVVSDPDAMTACVVQSVLESDVRVILSKGWSDRLQTKKDVAPGEEAPAEETPEEKAEKEKLKIAKEREMFPAEVFPIASVPHDWLFPRIDAACHHGGAGTTGASLRAGIPTIILPFFGDQYFWADRVEVLGVGSGMKKLSQDHLTAALKTATTDEKQIRKAKALGEEIRAENGVATAIEAIYRDLEYARSLIKHPHASSSSSSSSAESSPTNSPISSPVRRTTPLPSHSRSESTTPPAPGSDESWDVVTGEDQRRSSEGGSGSGSGGGSSTRSSKVVSGGLGLVGSVVNGVVGGIGGKLGIGK